MPLSSHKFFHPVTIIFSTCLKTVMLLLFFIFSLRQEKKRDMCLKRERTVQMWDIVILRIKMIKGLNDDNSCLHSENVVGKYLKRILRFLTNTC